MQVTKSQLSKIHVQLSQLGLQEKKKMLVLQYTNGRSESSRDLTMQEAKELIMALSKYDPCDPMRRKVFSLAYDAEIIWGTTSIDKKINAIKLDNFLLTRGTVKKELKRMTREELIKTISQFKQIIKHQEEKSAEKAVTELLHELEIPIAQQRKAKHS